jgi:histidinol-phosphate aminotransferase
MVAEVIKSHLSRLELYPDGAAEDLKAVLAESEGIASENIICSSGSEQILTLLAQAYAGPGDEVIQSQYGFLVYPIATRAVGADLKVALEQNFTTDVNAILALQSPKTKLIYLANPNNPTGTVISTDEVKRLRAGLREDILLVIDVAYAEYVTDEEYTNCHEMVGEAISSGVENVVVVHTFSKIYGLAGLRLGWCYGPPSVIDALNRIKGAFNVTTLTQLAGIAALEDQEHVKMSKDHNTKWLPIMTDALEKVGLKVSPSQGNFILVHFPNGDGQAVSADAYLRQNGIIVRPVGGYGLANCLRITIGSDNENHSLLEKLKAFMQI